MPMQLEKTSFLSRSALLFVVMFMAAGQAVEKTYEGARPSFGWNVAEYYYGTLVHKVIDDETADEKIYRDLSDYRPGHGIRS